MTLKTRHAALPPNLPPRGLSREEAAAYIGISPTTFDALIIDSRMPLPRQMRGRSVWDIREVDSAFSALPHVVREGLKALKDDDIWGQAAA